MTSHRSSDYLACLLRELVALPREAEWVEFKVGDGEPQAIGELPAPLFERPDGFTRTVLFAHKPLKDMSRADRVRACYLHACLRYVTRQPMTNTSVRERFGIQDANAAIASRLLAEAVDAGLIVVDDPKVGTRRRTYKPFWAASPPEAVV